MGVPETAAPAAGDDDALADSDEVGKQRTVGLVEDGRTGRDVEIEVVAGRAVPPGSLATAAGGRLEVVLVSKVPERRLARVDAEVDRSASTAVASIRTAAWNVGFSAERRRPVAAVSGANEDRDAVEEHLG